MEKGFALLELSIWSAVLLPIVLLAISIFAQIYDAAITHMVPAALLRETPGHLVRWQPDGVEGTLVVDRSSLRNVTDGLVGRGMTELSNATSVLTDYSALACWWALSIDPVSGVVAGVDSSACSSRGPLAAQLSLDAALQSHIASAHGIPVESGCYSRVRIVVGVAVGGQFRGLIPSAGDAVLTGNAVSGVREEMSL